MQQDISSSDGTLLISSSAPALLNLPWELLPSPTSAFLVADGRWAIRRTTRETLATPNLGQVALPLRILFAACAPIDQDGLDYEKEEAMLRLAGKLGNKVHLSIAEAATFDELRNLISELKPHIVHLSGHGIVQDGIGYFTFEDEHGLSDLRDARSMAEQLFANRGVRVVFVSGCQSAQAASAGVCQTLTAAGHVPVALGWGASVADGLATNFASVFYHELAAGRPVDASVATARRDLFGNAHFTVGEAVYFDASFTLPQIFAADATDDFIDQSKPLEKVALVGVRYELLGDNVVGLKEGFVGRRRLLQRLRPGLRDADFHVLLLTGMGGAGKSTLATRLANRCQQEGFHVVVLKASRKNADGFALRLAQEIGFACQRLGKQADYEMLHNGKQPLSARLRLAVEILKESRILLVLDNLEDLMPLPPAAPQWASEELTGFFASLFGRLTGAGRCILTCRYVPEDFDTTQPGRVHEPLPDFSEAEFIKCLTRNARVVERMAAGEISREFLTLLHRKIGGTPRFIKQAADVLATADIETLQQQLVSAPDADGDHALNELREKYLEEIFVPELYEALAPAHRLALSRLALLEPPVPIDGVAQIGGLTDAEASDAVTAMLARGLLQQLGEDHEAVLYAIYPLQRSFLANPARLPPVIAVEAHCAAAAFFESCFKSGREQELRLHVIAELLTCRHHAESGGDRERLELVTGVISLHLYRSAEFKAAVAFLEPLADERAQPRTLKLLADTWGCLSEWPRAKALYLQALARFESAADRAGEAATWHQLATIEVSEGNYSAAREKFGRALEMQQAIGDQNGVASIWHQLASIEMREGNYKAAREGFGRSLEIKQAIGDLAGEAATWHQLATIEVHEGDYAAAREKYGRSLEAKQAIGDRAAEAATLHQLATIEVKEGNYAAAREMFGRSLEIEQAIGNRAGEAVTWHSLATIELNEGGYAAAREKFGRALVMLQAIGDQAGEAATWHQLAMVDLNEGDYRAAREKFGRSLEIKQAIGDRAGEAATWHNLATIELKEGDYGAARERFGRVLEMSRAIGDRIGVAATWHNLATIELNEGNYITAWEKFGRALEIRQAIGDRAGEARTLGQIGFLAWENAQKETGIRLQAIAFMLLKEIGEAEQQVTWKNVIAMASEMGLNQAGFEAMLKDAAEQYQQDRGHALISSAYEGLQ
ncbi:MAG: tetratricopeptide repeat protein [Prosthecobacter sp.]|nr:tetratricopeptide repeat protein [Prosthecobacter sp.]